MVFINKAEEDKRLLEFRHKEAEDLAKIRATEANLSYVDLSKQPIEIEALSEVDEQTAREGEFIPFIKDGSKLYIAVENPFNLEVRNFIQSLSEKKQFHTTVFVASHFAIKNAFSKYVELEKIKESQKGVIDASSFTKETTTIANVRETMYISFQDGNISTIVSNIMSSGVLLGASDIHIEPEEIHTHVRLRIDGVLIELISFETVLLQKIMSRFKLMASVKINIRTEPQDGRFSITIKETQLEVRASFIPGAFGESLVMRLLDPKSTMVTMDTLGINPNLRSRIEKELKKPNGLVLTTGPTGSGKTTAMYAFLRTVQEPGIKIITIENPVEYHMEGIVQTQVDKEKGYDFSDGLKTALRQDPDIIMVGEIRDTETATTAIQAALTGHLVFSTLHTNNALGAIPRMLDLGCNSDTFGSAVNMILAQRLVRRIIPEIAIETAFSDREKKIIETHLHDVPEELWLQYYVQGTSKKAPLAIDSLVYKGRVGVFEAIIMNDQIEELIQNNASTSSIKDEWKKQGILTLEQDAIIKILQGVTDFEEVERIISLE